MRVPFELAGTIALTFAVTLGSSGCAATKGSKTAVVGLKDPDGWPTDDRSMCNWKNRTGVEVSEAAGPGAMRPNVRRVYKDVGEGESRHKVLICREVDTNLDGIKDVVRTFNAKGETVQENADTNFDGKIDNWATYIGGRLHEEDEDTNRDGARDVWKVYANGKLSHVTRDRNFDGKPDAWEMYVDGRLERMGVDETFDGHVDRWDHDEAVRNPTAADSIERASAAMAPTSTSNTIGTAK